MSIAGLLVPLGLSENQPSGDDLLNELGDRDRGWSPPRLANAPTC